MAAPLQYLLIVVKATVLQKVSVSDMQNLKTVSWHTGCRWEDISFEERQFDATNLDPSISKTKNFFWIFFCIFEISFNFWTFSKKRITLIAELFPKLGTPKNMITSMSKKSSFNGSFGKQHGKDAQSSLKFPWQYLYHIYWSLWIQLTSKKSLLVTCKISRLFPNTLSVDGKYSGF